MAEERLQRRLAAILAADVVGYSRLMGLDEAGTLAQLKALRREVFAPTIAEFGGRIFKLTGDGAFAEFGSAADAVSSAVAVQRTLAERSAGSPDNGRIELRIGISLGDVIVEGSDLYGNGVNVAARLEGLAEPGGICISGNVFEHVGQSPGLVFEDLGDQTVKNIERPVRCYRVQIERSENSKGSLHSSVLAPNDAAGGVIVAPERRSRAWQFSAVAMVVVAIFVTGSLAWWRLWDTNIDRTFTQDPILTLPDNPSIAVLPFHNMSSDNFAEVVSLDVAENLTTELSRLPDILVVSRASTKPYKDKTVNTQSVAKELDVRYVLEGSVWRLGDRLKIEGQLADAQTGNNLWGKTYNRALQDASTVQKEITQDVLAALEPKLVEGTRERILRSNTNSAEAYTLARRGLALLQGHSKAENAQARRSFQKAAESDPTYSIAWHLLSYTYNASWTNGWYDDGEEERARAEKFARVAVANQPFASGPHILLSTLSIQRGRYNEAVAFGKKAVSLASNDAMAVAHLGRILAFVARREEAILLMRQAIRLSPYTPPPILFFEGLGYHSLSRYEEALAEFESIALRSPNRAPVYGLLAITSANLGRMDEARVAAKVVLKVNPNFSAKGFVKTLGYKDHVKSEDTLDTLRQLGLAG